MRFDNDVNFLLIPHLRDNILINNRDSYLNLSSLLQLESSSNKRSGEMSLLDSIQAYYPLIQIAVSELEEGLTEGWDVQGQEPIIAYVPTNIVNDIIPAFNNQGEYVELSASNSPKELVIIISENERVIEVSRNNQINNFRALNGRCPILDPVFQSNEYDYFLKTEYYDALACELIPIDGGGGSGGGTPQNYCNRDRSTSKDRTYRLKLNSSTVYKDAKDGWFNNDLEFRVDILFGQKNGTISNLTKYFDAKQKDVKDLQWLNIDAELVNWNIETYGDAMLFTWLEDDAGGTTKNTFNWSSKFEDKEAGTTETVGFSSEITIPKSHYPFGQSIVEYCDNKNGAYYTYNTGRLQFQIK